uniref:nucleoside diphosphate-linked moiety X motif 13-like n=1 Tax=Monopterus albus TaxID=43700 RepID=UPI0009B333B4|nr:nucleoside diphosphate-linked moiety X motif 13-like [Monopterus albus]
MKMESGAPETKIKNKCVPLVFVKMCPTGGRTHICCTASDEEGAKATGSVRKQLQERHRASSAQSRLPAMGKTLRILLSASKCPPSRCCSSFVSRMRYVNRLKEDEAACVAALQYSRVFLFHRLSPLLQRTERGTFTPAALISSDVQLILERLGSDGSLLKDSVLIGCSEQNQPQFCLDVGELDQAAVEKACEGTFMDLRSSQGEEPQLDPEGPGSTALASNQQVL